MNFLLKIGYFWLASIGIISLSVPRIWAGIELVSSLINLNFEQTRSCDASGGLAEENRELRDALSRAEQRLVEVQKTLAVTASESELFKRQALELKKRFEALGAAPGSDEKKLEQRLLSAVNELQANEFCKNRLMGAAIRLTEAVATFLRTGVESDVKIRVELESAVRGVHKVIEGSGLQATPVSATLEDGLVISVRDDLLLVVANLGRMHGVKIGMPFQVIRNGAVIGEVRVVDVREKFAGAAIQNLSSEKNHIRIGDRLKVESQP